MPRAIMIFLVSVSMVACGCEGTKKKTSAPATAQKVDPYPGRGQSLEHRATEHWQAKLDENWDVLFKYVEPGLRAESTPAQFAEWSRENEPFQILSYEIDGVKTEGELGWVRIYYRTKLRKYPTLPEAEANQWQKWLRVNDEWMPVPAQAVPLFPEPPDARDAEAEAIVRARFIETWELRTRGDWAQLYQLTDPRDRGVVSEQEFRESESMFEYLSYEILWVEVIGNQGRVRVRIHHKLLDPSMTKVPPQDVNVTENWVRVDGQWYRDLTRG